MTRYAAQYRSAPDVEWEPIQPEFKEFDDFLDDYAKHHHQIGPRDHGKRRAEPPEVVFWAAVQVLTFEYWDGSATKFTKDDER